MTDLISEIIEITAKKFNRQKSDIILSRIKERVGVDLNLDEELKKTFPRIVGLQHDDGKEEWRWNDGSDDGVLLVTFMPITNPPLDFNKTDFPITLKIEQQYI